jgi:hypothetical protein
VIICKSCGFQNQDTDTFCGSCATFLEWSGERVAPPEPELLFEPEAEEESEEPERIGLIEKVKEVIGIGEERSGGSTAAAVEQTAPPASPPGAAPPAPPVPAEPGAAASPAPAPQSPAPAPQAPPPSAPAEPAPVQPQAVKPQAAVRPRVARPKRQPSSRVIKPGDRICGNCGEGNDPARNFCRRCGASLAEAEVYAPGWWARLVAWFRRRRLHAAGERPKARRRLVGGRSQRGLLTTWATRVLALAVIAFVVLLNVGPYKSTIRHRFAQWYRDVAGEVHPTYTPVHPIAALASASAPGHPPAYAIDGATNTCWQAAGANDGVGQSITLQLASPTSLAKVGFLDGDQDSASSFLSEPRARVLRLTFVASAKGVPAPVRDVTLHDLPAFQTFTVNAKDVTKLTITIESVYPSAQGHNTSMAEIELFEKS